MEFLKIAKIQHKKRGFYRKPGVGAKKIKGGSKKGTTLIKGKNAQYWLNHSFIDWYSYTIFRAPIFASNNLIYNLIYFIF